MRDLERELTKLDVACRSYEAEQWHRHMVTEKTIRDWGNKRGYVV
jgi:hypothetical protein